MAPKFKGDSDDWMDADDSNRQSSSSKKKKKQKAEALSPDEANATVAEVFPGQCRVRLDEGPSLLCKYRRADVLGHSAERERAPVAVGDRVKAARVGGPQAKEGIVEGVCERRNRVVRPAPAQTTLHVLAANVDVLVIVAAVAEPEFTSGLVDRFLIAAQAQGIAPLICINKIDLQGTGGRPWDLYRHLGFEVHEVSAKGSIGIDALRVELLSKTVVFCGKSGVGKTSVLTRLLGVDAGRVGEVSGATGKGKHTTTSAVLLEGVGAGSSWIDTPGVREFGLRGVEPSALKDYFPEFKDLRCANASCTHLDEAGCEAGALPRYSSYRRIYESLAAGEN